MVQRRKQRWFRNIDGATFVDSLGPRRLAEGVERLDEIARSLTSVLGHGLSGMDTAHHIGVGGIDGDSSKDHALNLGKVLVGELRLLAPLAIDLALEPAK